jgi:hypothetical protein
MKFNNPGIIKELLIPIAIVIAIYLVLIAIYIHPYQNNISSLVKLDALEPNYRLELIPTGTVVFLGNGYDGQYNFYIIKDLWFHGTFNDAFRYQRILYPILVNFLAFGYDNLLFVSFILVNFISIIIGMIYLWKLIGQPNKISWLVLYGINLGFIFGTLFDLGTSVAISLIVISLYYLKQNKIRLTSIFLALSLLTMENAILIIGALILYCIYKKEWKKTGYMLVSIIPWLLWQVVLWKQFGVIPILSSSGVLGFPFMGMEIPIIYLLHQNYSGIKDILRNTNVVWMMLFIIMSLIVSAYQYSKSKDMFSWMILVHAIFGICLSHTFIWSHTITSPARVLSGIFPLVILTYSQNQADKLSKILYYFTWFLALLGIIRIFLLPTHPFFIT